MKIYTKTGDEGQTGLWGGQRVDKDSFRVQAYGTIDECNAIIGAARASGVEANLDVLLGRIQDELFVVGADIATPGEKTRIDRIGEKHITQMENEIDQLEKELPPLQQFILPGGTLGAAHLHLSRTVCRRAERLVVTLAKEETLNEWILPYLNRLSDWLFIAARVANARSGVSDIPWNSPV